MVKALTFKGDAKKTKKRKRTAPDGDSEQSTSKALTTTPHGNDADTDDDTWVNADAITDIAGPVIFVLPTDEPSCIACDVNGKVFSLPVENMIEGDPATSEPHDVRQVWVASRVAGTENFTFKGHHTRYLGCDKSGVMFATREAISPEESFLIIPIADQPGSFAVQIQRDSFLTVDPDARSSDRTIRADGDAINFNSTLRIRMQARFKPKHKVAKAEKAREKISRKELEALVGRILDEEDVKLLKKARREGDFHEKLLDVKVKGKHDKFA